MGNSRIWKRVSRMKRGENKRRTSGGLRITRNGRANWSNKLEPAYRVIYTDWSCACVYLCVFLRFYFHSFYFSCFLFIYFLFFQFSLIRRVSLLDRNGVSRLIQHLVCFNARSFLWKVPLYRRIIVARNTDHSNIKLFLLGRIHRYTDLWNGTTVGFVVDHAGGNFPIIFRHRNFPSLTPFPRKFYTAFTIPNDWCGNLICGHETRGGASRAIHRYVNDVIIKIYSNYSILVPYVFAPCTNNICHSRFMW